MHSAISTCRTAQIFTDPGTCLFVTVLRKGFWSSMPNACLGMFFGEARVEFMHEGVIFFFIVINHWDKKVKSICNLFFWRLLKHTSWKAVRLTILIFYQWSMFLLRQGSQPVNPTKVTRGEKEIKKASKIFQLII